MKWFFKCLRQYADFSGRARRKEYWWFSVINFIISLVLIIGFITSIYSNIDIQEDVDEFAILASVLKSPFIYIYLIYYLVMLIPSIAVFVRRLHDIGRSGYWALLFYGISILANFASVMLESNENVLLTLLILFIMLFATVLFLVWLFTDSQYGPNQWGPNPKGEGNPEEATNGEVQLS